MGRGDADQRRRERCQLGHVALSVRDCCRTRAGSPGSRGLWPSSGGRRTLPGRGCATADSRQRGGGQDPRVGPGAVVRRNGGNLSRTRNGAPTAIAFPRTPFPVSSSRPPAVTCDGWVLVVAGGMVPLERQPLAKLASSAEPPTAKPHNPPTAQSCGRCHSSRTTSADSSPAPAAAPSRTTCLDYLHRISLGTRVALSRPPLAPRSVALGHSDYCSLQIAASPRRRFSSVREHTRQHATSRPLRAAAFLAASYTAAPSARLGNVPPPPPPPRRARPQALEPNGLTPKEATSRNRRTHRRNGAGSVDDTTSGPTTFSCRYPGCAT